MDTQGQVALERPGAHHRASGPVAELARTAQQARKALGSRDDVSSWQPVDSGE